MVIGGMGEGVSVNGGPVGRAWSSESPLRSPWMPLGVLGVSWGDPERGGCPPPTLLDSHARSADCIRSQILSGDAPHNFRGMMGGEVKREKLFLPQLGTMAISKAGEIWTIPLPGALVMLYSAPI